MNLSMANDFLNPRAFGDEREYNPSSDSFASVLVRASGALCGGLALTAMLAVLVHH